MHIQKNIEAMEKEQALIESTAIRERRRKRLFRVVMTDTLMVLSVIVLVGVSLLMAMGYSLNTGSNVTERVVRTGLLAIQTKPTGASIMIDGNTVFGWTNTSKTLTEGEHEIVLTRDGYTTWSKKITIPAGMLYRLNYPRLFLSEIAQEKMVDFGEIEKYTVAHDENTMLVVNKAGKFGTYKINEEKLTYKEMEFAVEDGSLLMFVSWSGNSKKLLMENGAEWWVLNVDKPAESVNLTEKFGIEIAQAKFAGDAGERVIVVDAAGKLRKIDLSGNNLGEVISGGVVDFYNLGENVVFVTEDETGKSVKMLLEGESKPTTILTDEECGEGCVMKAVMNEYYGDKYLAIVDGGNLVVYKGEWPRYEDTENKMEIIAEAEIKFAVDGLEVRGDGEIIIARDSEKSCALEFDTEIEGVKEFSTGVGADFVDNNLMYEVVDGGLAVMDFDGQNRVSITEENVDGTGEVRLSKNDKWMYYLGGDGWLYRAVIAN